MQWQTELTKQNSENENYEDKLNYLLKSWKLKQFSEQKFTQRSWTIAANESLSQLVNWTVHNQIDHSLV